MKDNIEFIEKLDRMLLYQGNKYSLDGYSFFCSKLWNNGMKEYKGIPIYYYELLRNDFIGLIPTPYAK
jgi:hypothetical protein